MRTFIAAALLAAGLAGAASAQDVLDRGTFLIVRSGLESGREEFAIRSTTGRQGPGVLAVGTTRSGNREFQHALELTADHTPITFQETETVGGRVVRRVAAQLDGIRFSARIASADGEAVREFPVRPPVVVLGADAFSAFYFVPRARAGQTRPVSVVRSETGRSVTGSVVAEGADTVTVAGRLMDAERYTLRLSDGEERRFWFTATGDLLRVAIPATQTVATRSDPPPR